MLAIEEEVVSQRASRRLGKGNKREMIRETRWEGNTGYPVKTCSIDDLSRIRTPEENEVLSHYFCYGPEQAYASQPRKHPQAVVMSGMDLLIQREQERAKRQKPKNGNNPGKEVKIEGLLGKVPEPGTHNISFQHLQQQAMKPKKNKITYFAHDHGRISPMPYLPNYPSMHPVYPALFYPSPSSSRQSSSASLSFV
ncbi:hypothetical protein BY458DRAFT_508525 [Sporodiniella umbellata]|nr:hypothetical protein BY458DRAFT_508525 [Sporodiniella umbellata]